MSSAVGERRVGNDVVDLVDPRVAGKVRDERFLERVLAPPERSALAASADPETMLWSCWAAKEAAYKVVSKLRASPPVFVHREYVLLEGAVLHQERRYPVVLSAPGRLIHAVAVAGLDPGESASEVRRLDEPRAPWNASLEELVARMTRREADAVHSLASAAVRIGARAALARALGVQERRLEIVCAPGVTGRRPPRVLLDGDPAPADVSLSHHGRWIAWAFTLPAG